MTERVGYFVLPWEMGNMHVALTDKGICRLSVNTTARSFERELLERDGLVGVKGSADNEIAAQLEQYLAGKRKRFEVDIDIRDGTPFQRKVWQNLRKVPYGVTMSYQDIARLVGGARYARAVGNANGRNPIGIIVPCHRVIRKNGDLGGYTGGIKYKRHFLELEGVQL